MDEKLRAAIIDALDKKLGYYRQPDGTFSYEIYADYRDEMDNKSAIEILQSKEPMETFWEKIDEWYSDYEWQLRSELEQELETELTDDDGPFPQGLPDEEENPLHDLLLELVYFQFPEEHFLKQTFPVDIMVNTGDGNSELVWQL